MVAWLNRIGLTLQFIALFLVTPEIVGREKIERLSDAIWVRPVLRFDTFARKHWPVLSAIRVFLLVMLGYYTANFASLRNVAIFIAIGVLVFSAI
jgi:hypothetical protein